jgi:hypothetical protein
MARSVLLLRVVSVLQKIILWLSENLYFTTNFDFFIIRIDTTINVKPAVIAQSV